MPRKQRKATSCLNNHGSYRDISPAATQTAPRIDRLDPAILAAAQTPYPGNVGHCINNPANSILLDSQSLAKIWGLVAPILDEKTGKENAVVVAGYTLRELKKDMKKLFMRIERNTRRVKRIIEDLQECDLDAME